MADGDRLSNLKRSLESYFQTHYLETAIEFPGTTALRTLAGQVTTKDRVKEWVRFSFTGPDSQYAGRKEGKKAYAHDLILAVNCFVKVPPEKADRVWVIAGKAVAVLQGKDIELRDFTTSGTPALEYIRCHEPNTEYMGLDTESGMTLEHISITVPAYFIDTVGP